MPPSRYETLSSSDEPFVCLCCSNYQLRKELAQVKSELSVATALTDTVESLKMEVKQLKETLAAVTSELSSLRSNRPPSKSTYASMAAARGPAQQARHRTLANKDANRSNWAPSTTSTTTTAATTSTLTSATATGTAHVVKAKAQKMPRAKVPGVIRVWGTKKDASTTVVMQTVRQLTQLDSKKRLSVKRKFHEGKAGQRDRWWFLIRGSEAVLNELESLWNCVSLQVGWKLEECTKPCGDSGDGTTNVSRGAGPCEGSSVVAALNDSSNSPIPANTSSPGTSGEAPSSQSVDMKTYDIDINTHKTVSDNSHHNTQDSPLAMGTD